MKTPEEIKKGLECCMDYQSCAEYGESKCPYNDVTKCMEVLFADALAYIQQFESRLAQAERERDAALKDIANTCWSCRNAKPSQLSKFLYSCPHLKGKAGVRTQCENWQWRGVCPEKTRENAK